MGVMENNHLVIRGLQLSDSPAPFFFCWLFNGTCWGTKYIKILELILIYTVLVVLNYTSICITTMGISGS